MYLCYHDSWFIFMIGHDKSYHNPLQSVFDLPEADLTMQTIRKSTNLLHHADHFGSFGILKIISLSLIFAFFQTERRVKGILPKKDYIAQASYLDSNRVW